MSGAPSQPHPFAVHEDWLAVPGAAGDTHALNLLRVALIRLADEADPPGAVVSFSAGQAPRQLAIAPADPAGLRAALARRGWPRVQGERGVRYLNPWNIAAIHRYREGGREKAGVFTTAGVVFVDDEASLVALRRLEADRLGPAVRDAER